MEPASSNRSIEWAVAHQPLPGEEVSGDVHLVLEHDKHVLLAVIDGIGHGPEATHAAEVSLATLRARPESSVLQHLSECHQALAHTRGAVMTLADFQTDEDTLTLAGVGNVEAVLFRARTEAGAPAQERALLRGGTLGSRLPPPYASVVPVFEGDVLVMASDGVRTDFPADLGLKMPPQRLADQLLHKHNKGNDDALVLVARFHPSTP